MVIIGVYSMSQSNLLTARDGSCIFFSRDVLSGVAKAGTYSLEDGNCNRARVIWSTYYVYSHMCQG